MLPRTGCVNLETSIHVFWSFFLIYNADDNGDGGGDDGDGGDGDSDDGGGDDGDDGDDDDGDDGGGDDGDDDDGDDGDDGDNGDDGICSTGLEDWMPMPVKCLEEGVAYSVGETKLSLSHLGAVLNNGNKLNFVSLKFMCRSPNSYCDCLWRKDLPGGDWG